MDINQITAQLDEKIISVDERLRQLHERVREQPHSTQTAALVADLETLERIRERLLKSRDIALRVHQLSTEHHNPTLIKRRQYLGASLMTISFLLALLIGYFVVVAML